MNWNSIPFISFLVLMTMLRLRIRILKKKGIRTGSGNGEKNPVKKILLPVFSLVFLLWLFELARPAFQIEFSLLPNQITIHVFINETVQLAGSILILFSLIFFQLTLKKFGTSLRFGLDKNEQGQLITSGIFSFSRNPFFLSLDLYFIGVAMVLPTAFHIGFTLAALLGIHVFILKEERFLEKIHGETYQKYKQKVRRYL